MKKKLYFYFCIFIFLSNNIFSQELNQTIFAYWNNPDVTINYITPEKIDENTKITFIFYNSDDDIVNNISGWKDFSKNKNHIIVAPYFDKNFKKEKNDLTNKSLDLFFNFFKSKFNIKENSYNIFANESGCDFVQEYLLISSSKKIDKVILVNSDSFYFIPYSGGNNQRSLKLSNSQIKNYLSYRLYIVNNSLMDKTRTYQLSERRKKISNLYKNSNYITTMEKYSEEKEYPFRWNYRTFSDSTNLSALKIFLLN